MGLIKVLQPWDILLIYCNNQLKKYNSLAKTSEGLTLHLPSDVYVRSFLCPFLYLIELCYTKEKAMATHSNTFPWKIPWMEEPGRPQSMGSLRVGHDWATSLSLFTFMHWRRKWQPTPVFLPGESQGWGSLVGCCLWGCIELDMAEMT